MGPGNRSAIGTLVERSTRFVVLLAFCDGVRTTAGVRTAICEALERLAAGLRRTLTWDQGKELAYHQQITQLTGTPVFFCDAHAPWQRGGYENMNGLLRDYFPEGSDLRTVTGQRLTEVAGELNDGRRNTLGWQRPASLFNAALIAA
jgi:IS30 family transposase